MKEAMPIPIEDSNVTTSYDNEARLQLSPEQSTIEPFSDPDRTGLPFYFQSLEIYAVKMQWK